MACKCNCKKKVIIAVSITAAVLIAGFVGFLIYQHQNKSEFEKAADKTAEFGEKLGDWGKDVGKSTKKLFD
ncbi:MAG: hypothetical protein J6S24_03365 [Lentisphaeria bacterium]|nr:hypothetical protein [Lentisphaeria bacterium]MBO5765303.1 hypothetical protein [Lentisphaeria bacterium]MBO5900516.1 hypothetical protein [Lentisphaeria bacterium]MBO5990658.1 hypothetical protein [Lentisphaeria bacterium]MBO7152518.1 hypothetical protein [Lentisphaeria bacterium]